MAEQTREIVYIDSQNRSHGTEANFFYQFKPRSETFDRVTVLSVTIPKTYYLVDEHARTMWLEEDGKETPVTVEAGDYDVKTFAARMTEALNAASMQGLNYSMVYPHSRTRAITGKYNFTYTDPSPAPVPHVVRIRFEIGLNRQMGFDRKSTTSFVNHPDGTGTLTSENVVNFQRTSTFFLASDLVGGENDTDIMQEIFAAGEPFMSNITYECPDVEATSRRILNIKKGQFNFQLQDQDREHIDMNGHGIIISLLLYDSRRYHAPVPNLSVPPEPRTLAPGVRLAATS